MPISANMIKELRIKTRAGILDCKKALEKTNLNLEEAIVWLKKKGLLSAGKKAGRESTEGVVAIFTGGNKATVIELSSETDFVAKNEKFLNLANFIVKSAHNFKNDSFDKFLELGKHNLTPINKLIAEHISIIGENILLKKINKLSVENGKLISYVHNKLADNIGKIGVVVALEGDINEEIENFGKQLAMHIAALRPVALNQKSLDPNILKKERDILRKQTLESVKPMDVVEKITEGRIGNFLEEIILLEQQFVIDGKTKIKKVIEELESKNNCKFNVSGYIRYEVGEI